MTCVEPLLTTIFYCLLLFGPNGSLYVVVMLLSFLKTACLVFGKPLPSFPGCLHMYTAMYVRSNVTFFPNRYVPKENFSDVVSLGSVLGNRNYLSQFRFRLCFRLRFRLRTIKSSKKICNKPCLFVVNRSSIVA
jgi:hypothetical protein